MTDFYIQKAVGSNLKIKIEKIGNPDPINLKYKIGLNGQWQDYTIGQWIIHNRASASTNSNRIYLSGNNDHFSKDSNNYYHFVIDGDSNINTLNGDITSLAYDTVNQCIPPYAFFNAFKGCRRLDLSRSNFYLSIWSNNKKNGDYCFSNMFAECLQLENAPFYIDVGDLAPWACAGMFKDCKKLKNCSDIKGNLSPYSCFAMYYGCQNLQNYKYPSVSTNSCNAPFCMATMFKGCKNLKTVDLSNITSIDSNSFKNMFENCQNLEQISVGFTEWNSATDNWASFVRKNGVFLKPAELEAEYGKNKIPSSWTVLPTVSDPLTFAATKNGTFGIQIQQVEQIPNKTYYYKKNNDAWKPYNLNNYINIEYGDAVSFMSPTEDLLLGKHKFNTSGTVGLSLYGNLLSLVNNSLSSDTSYMKNLFSGCTQLTNVASLKIPAPTKAYSYQYTFADCSNLTAVPKLTGERSYSYCYWGMFQNCTNLKTVPANMLSATSLDLGCYYTMFKGCTSLTTVPNLPSLSLARSCYNAMFYGCTSLSSVPSDLLPATSAALGCYVSMFGDCTSLTAAPQLPATTLMYRDCYAGMFYGCSSLLIPPSTLPATTLVQNCYEGMFNGCRSLTAVPTLPATSLASSCYSNMFRDCTSISSVPSDLLPAMDVDKSSYKEMFWYCTALSNAPVLPATGLAENCYENMFAHCYSLSTVSQNMLPATSLARSCYHLMFANCSSLLDAPVLPATTLAIDCYYEMFTGCSSLTGAPQLPASTLINRCYGHMFFYCTSLSDAPQLPATELRDWCYNSMFNRCQSLTSISVKFTEWTPQGVINPTTNWIVGVAPTGVFTKPSALPDENYSDSKIPLNWTVINYDEPTIDTNLIWHMDFTSGLYQPYSEITGYCTNDSQYQILTDSQVGNYLHCDADGNNVQWRNSQQYLADNLSGTDPFTVSFWLRAPEWYPWSNGLLCWRNGASGAVFYNDGFNDETTDQINCRNGRNYWAITSTRPGTLGNTWNLWTFTRDENGAKWYLNGELDRDIPDIMWQDGDQVTPQEADVTAGRDIIIGYNEWTSRALFDVTKIRIYNRALTSSQIQYLYDNKL